MRTIFLDSEFRCHLQGGGTMQAVQTDYFDGKCRAFVEGYRLVPVGQQWTREDGMVFRGEMTAPAEDYRALSKAQAQYEADMAAVSDMVEALEILGVTE